ncbi:MAG: A/G-specific adenine glycosylase [bacterium]|nr:A/G-specific adenine glycosylase [bacterium]
MKKILAHNPLKSRDLLLWYQNNARELPWRKTSDPYKIWISEVMLQQTTVNAVINYYHRWLKRFPTIQSLARGNIHDILNLWQGLGYYQRARNIHKAAQIIYKDHHGEIPKNPKVLRKLPGFGPYTTNAVLSIAYELRLPLIDTNIRRLVMRQLALRGVANIKQNKTITTYLEKIMPKKNISFFNQALMELGALICKPKNPLCLLCPIQKNCKAFQKGIQELIPKTSKNKIKKINAAIALIQKERKFFIQKRPEKGLLAGLWEFPGGKQEKEKKIEETLKREIKEELKVSVTKSDFLMKVKHYYTQFAVTLHVFTCDVVPFPLEDDTHKWVILKNLKNFPMPSGSAKIVSKLKHDDNQQRRA